MPSLLVRWSSPLVFGAYVMFVVAANAEEPSTNATNTRIEQLVQQLGDESFLRRESAMRELSILGLKAKYALLSGIQGTNPEIQWRCARLWKAVRDLDFQQRSQAFLNEADENESYEFPGWQRYRKILGSSRDARKLFLELQQAEPLAWAQLGGNVASPEVLFANRADRLQSLLLESKERNRIALGSVATLLFLAVENRLNRSQQETATVKVLVELPIVQDALRYDSSLRQLWVMWRAGTVDERPAFERLMSSLRNGLEEEARVTARTMLRKDGISAEQRQYALLALAKSNDAADETLVRAFLDDATPLDTYFSRGVVIKSQLRDVALATLIFRSGGDLKDFGFKYLRLDASTLFSPATLGFKDYAERDAAFQKWSDLTAGRAK